MAPALGHLRRLHDAHGAFLLGFLQKKTLSDDQIIHMAQEPSYSTNQEEEEEEEEEREEVATTATTVTTTTSNSNNTSWLQLGPTSAPVPPQIERREGKMELELFPGKPSSSSSSSNPEIGGIAPMLYGGNWNRNSTIAAAEPAMTAVDIAVVPPPRSPAGVWFFLQASQNQGKEPFLPQIPKGYLRIKDGSITVRLLIKYLVNKLGLEDESEVEIACRGRRLLPSLTLQQVRDSIWCSRAVAPPSIREASVADHLVMVLQYGRTA